MLAKKANAGALVLLVIVIIILVIWWVSVANRECNVDLDCEAEHYCGSDFRCHQIPVIEKTVKSYDTTIASLILAIGLVVAAIILRKKSLPSWFNR